MPEANAQPPPAEPAPPGHDLPLSEELLEIVRFESDPRKLNLNRILLWTEGRGIFLFLILLCFPFLTPVSIPGSSVPVGMLICLLGIRVALGLPPRLPRWVGDRPLPARARKVLEASVKVLRFLERFVRPRRTGWMTWRPVLCAHGLLVAFLGFLLALPLGIPFTNTTPAYATLLVALSMMEEDGLLIWLGYLATAGTVAYFVAWERVIVDLAQKYLGPLLQWLQSWL